MPRVPFNPTVDVNALPGVRSVAAQNNLPQIGGAIMGAGASLGDIAKREQELRNADRIMRAEASMRDDYLKFETSLQDRKGTNAWGVTNDVSKWFDDNGKNYLKGLENDAQRALFEPQLIRLREQGTSSAARFEASERRASLEETAKASIVTATNLAAASWDNPDALAGAKSDIVKRVGLQAGFNGWTPERRVVEESAALTNLHKQVIQAMADKDPKGAREYFAANKSEIAGSDQKEIENVVRLGGLKVMSQQASDALVAKGMTEAETLKEARANYEGEERDAVVTRVQQRFAEGREQATVREKEVADVAWDYFGRTGHIDDIPSSVLNELDGKTLQSLKSAARQEKVSTNWDTYYTLKEQALNDPAGFKKNDLRKYQDELGAGPLKSLMDLQTKATITPDVATLTQQLSTSHALLKLTKPADKGAFDFAVQTALDDAQTAKGDKKLTYDERQQVIDRMMMSGEVTGGGLFGLIDPDRRYYQVAGTKDAQKFVPDVESIKGFDLLTPAEQAELRKLSGN